MLYMSCYESVVSVGAFPVTTLPCATRATDRISDVLLLVFFSVESALDGFLSCGEARLPCLLMDLCRSRCLLDGHVYVVRSKHSVASCDGLGQVNEAEEHRLCVPEDKWQGEDVSCLKAKATRPFLF